MRPQTPLEEYYNKFNEDKRLKSRHGMVEYRVTMHYIRKYLELLEKDGENPAAKKEIRIADIGAGTGAYSIPLFEEGYDVTAVELVKHNLGVMHQKCPLLPCYQGNAKKLKRMQDNTYDVTLLFGPMYHLFGEEKEMALREAKRVTKPGGLIFVAYVMNEYSVVTYAIKERHILEVMDETGTLDATFHTRNTPENLYDYVRIEDINLLNEKAGLQRELIISPDGPADYIRPFLNQMTDEEFERVVQYQLATCERQDLIGAGAHTVDILRKPLS